MINLITEQHDLTVYQVHKLMCTDKIRFNPRKTFWTDAIQSRFIDSMLVRLPLPVFYVRSDSKKTNQWRTIDGYQRLISIQKFYSNVLRLTGLQLTDFDGYSFKDLPGNYRDIFENHIILQFYCILPSSPVIIDSIIQSRVNQD